MKKYIEEHRELIFWSTLIIILFILFISFIYSDILITVRHSINLWQTIYIGDPLGFYKINQNLTTDRFLTCLTNPTYEFPIFVIFAIWNFPLWIAQNFLHIKVTESLLCLFWLKSMLLVFLWLCIRVIKKISLEVGINKDNIKWLVFIFLSSPLLIISIFIMSQYDIISILFMLLGILAFIKGNKKWFIIWFSIAIPLKLFAVFIFIPLLLLDNKKVIQIIKYFSIGMLPLGFTKLLSFFMPMYVQSTSGFTGEMLSKLFSSGINVNFGYASLFFLAFFLILIFCYQKELKNKDERNKYSIYIPLIIFSSFFMFVDFHPYWIIILVPFLTIVFFQNMKNFKVNIILDTLLSIAFILVTMITYYWCYGPLVIQRMIIPHLFGSTYGIETRAEFAGSAISKYGGEKLMPFFLATFITSLAAILIINFPRNSKDNNNKVTDWGMIFIRLLIIIPVPIMMVFCYYYR